MTVLTSSQLLVTVKEDSAVEPPKSSIKTICYLHWKMILAEFISTFFLVFFGCMTCVPLDGKHLQPLYSSLGFGLIVIFNIQAFGHISEAHMNPAITFIAIIWKKMSVTLGVFYIIAQLSGAVAGYGVLIGVTPTDLMINGTCVTQPHERYTRTVFQALVLEVLLTMALSFITCAVWDPVNKDSQECNSLKFGLTIVGLSLAGGQLTGASMNPARSLGPAVWIQQWRAHWIYWIGPLSGSALTAMFYKHMWLRTDKVVSDVKWNEDTLLQS
ncbi:aquaporin AQPAe.a-like [Epargyreus clarus]|uniref:aquaporin AQPAe.a-like n=1 Tax=Epargyreus clarus TaxID=520877 RepID=UPI003C2EB357